MQLILFHPNITVPVYDVKLYSTEVTTAMVTDTQF
jgi:hypothetical protein